MELRLSGRTYIAPAPKARMVRKAIEITEKTDFKNLTTAEFDHLVNFIADLYGGQFTLDDVYDGLEAEKLLPCILDCLNNVVGSVGAKLEQIPNGKKGV